jgi:hypothetical protein
MDKELLFSFNKRFHFVHKFAVREVTLRNLVLDLVLVQFEDQIRGS